MKNVSPWKEKPPTFSILGVRVDNIDRSTAMKSVRRYIANRRDLPARTIYFTNVHTIHLARKDNEFLRCINRADTVLPDGSGLTIAGKLFGNPIQENLNGTDLTPAILAEAQTKGWTVFLLGARPEALRRCEEQIKLRFPRLRVVGSHPGYFSSSEESDIVRSINNERPDILLVALGSPLQEQWISANVERLDVGVCLAVGGLFDFLSGVRKRAPLWMRRVGIEWIYRFFQDPSTKWDRVFIEIPFFLLLVLLKRFTPRSIQMFIGNLRLSHGK
ncbi:MAG: WecB/TagA/CpsF family glycosyltransferase [Ignavibacteriales bacterium]|nr:WecB/TagA/CpsF family glycosyltransferase [Ignavibacteriales bacterium]